jgi:hypothetical protein
MFKITHKKGFHITFENDYTVSVQFGPGNYCDNVVQSCVWAILNNRRWIHVQ